MYESVPYGLYDALPKDVPWKHGEFPWVSAYISCPVQKLAAAHRLTILVERTYEICTCDLEGGMQIDAHIIAAVRKGFERRAWYEVMRCELMEELVPLMFKTWHRHVRGEDGMGHGQPKWT
jgi:hypothetical protein